MLHGPDTMSRNVDANVCGNAIPGLPALGTPEAEDPSAFIARTEGITIADLTAAIPVDCLQPRLGRSLLAVLTSLLLTAVIYTALALNPYGWLLPPLWFLAGSTIWGFYVIGHDCGHGSFSKNRRLNHIMGHLMLTPLLSPFHSWRILHNQHHANTNNIEKDLDWRPLPAVLFPNLPWHTRAIYWLNRTWLWWTGSLYFIWTRAFFPSMFPEGHSRRNVRVSIAVVTIYAAIFFPTLIYFTGFWGLFKYFLIPWAIAYGWFSTITLTHHTHPQIPYLNKARWNPVMASLTMTVYCKYPRWTEFLGHDITVHIPHHVAPGIPWYNLRRSHDALKEQWPDLVQEFRFSWRYLLQLLRSCHLNDLRSGFYVPFSPSGRRGP